MTNLYFAGVQNKVAEDRLEEYGCYRLLSYLNDQSRIKRRIEKGLVTFIDSGAFSAHTKGVTIDPDHYINWLNTHDQYVSICAQLDTIPGRFGQPKTKEELEGAPELSWENYLYMRERLVSSDKCLPIYHQGEDFKHLVRMLEFTPKIPYIGISPANDVTTDQKEKWIDEVFRIIKKSSHPNVKTHAFGMTSLRVLQLYPFYSADSTTWIMTSANGGILSQYGTLTLSSKQLHDKNHIFHLPEPQRKGVEEYVQSKGYDLETLSTDYKQRTLWNIDFLTDWSRNYQYKPKAMRQTKLF